LRTRHQPEANQRKSTDGDQETRHSAHCKTPRDDCGEPFAVCTARKPVWLHRHSSPKQTASFIDRSSEIWNFGFDRPLTAVACSTGKVKP
jgi:hypothetical protein